jgi:hypothetical protein
MKLLILKFEFEECPRLDFSKIVPSQQGGKGG